MRLLVNPKVQRQSMLMLAASSQQHCHHAGAQPVEQADAHSTEGPDLVEAGAESNRNRSVDVAVQTDIQLLLQAPPGPALPSDDQARLRTPAQTAAVEKHQAAQQAAVPQTTVHRTSAEQTPVLQQLSPDHVMPTASEASQQERQQSKDAGCSASSDGSACGPQLQSADKDVHSQRACSNGDSAQQCSSGNSVAQAGGSTSSGSADKASSAVRAHKSMSHAGEGSRSSAVGSPCRRTSQAAPGRPQRDAVSVAPQDKAPIDEGNGGQQQRARGKAEGQRSRGLQLPQRLSVGTLAKHAGVDKAFMQVSVTLAVALLLLYQSVTASSIQADLKPSDTQPSECA